MIFLHHILSNQLSDSVYTCWNRDRAAESIRRPAIALKKSQYAASCLTPRRLFLIVPPDINYGGAHMTFKPNVHTSEPIDPAGFKLLHRLVRDLIQKHLEQQKLVIRSHRLDGFRRSSSCIHVVVDAFDRVVHVQGKFLGDLHILPSAYVRKMTADECVEFVREDLIEHFQVLMEICREIKSLERCIARCNRINDHQKFGFGNVDEKVAFWRMIVMARELDRFAAKFDCLLGLERYVWHQPIRVVHLLQKVTDAVERDDLEIFDVLECRGTTDMIFV